MRLNIKKQRHLVATMALAMLGTSLLTACGGTTWQRFRQVTLPMTIAGLQSV